MYILASALMKMMEENETITDAPKDCDDSSQFWETGKKLFHYLKERTYVGKTGKVAFDDNGDRIYAEYDVINVRKRNQMKVVGRFYYDNVSIVTTRAREGKRN